MDELKSQIKKLINSVDNRDLSDREAVEKALDYDRYVPKCEQGSVGQMYNPALNLYRQQHTLTDCGWSNTTNTEVLRDCPEYLPSDGALSVLCEQSLLEIGAGNGYWSYVINKNGGDCIPTDRRPRDVELSDIPDGYFSNTRLMEETDLLRTNRDSESYPRKIPYRNGEKSTIWTDVGVANHQYVTEKPDRNVLLCHPTAETWTEDLLDRMVTQEQVLFFIGEWYPGPDATPMFFKRLKDNWKLERELPVVDWKSMHAHGYKFVKS